MPKPNPGAWVGQEYHIRKKRIRASAHTNTHSINTDRISDFVLVRTMKDAQTILVLYITRTPDTFWHQNRCRKKLDVKHCFLLMPNDHTQLCVRVKRGLRFDTSHLIDDVRSARSLSLSLSLSLSPNSTNMPGVGNPSIPKSRLNIKNSSTLT